MLLLQLLLTAVDKVFLIGEPQMVYEYTVCRWQPRRDISQPSHLHTLENISILQYLAEADGTLEFPLCVFSWFSGSAGLIALYLLWLRFWLKNIVGMCTDKGKIYICISISILNPIQDQEQNMTF